MDTAAQKNIDLVPDDLKTLLHRHSAALAAQLQAHHISTYPPSAEKGIRHFSPAETAKLIGVTEGYLRQVAAEIPDVSTVSSGGRRSYSVEAIHELRKHLDAGARGNRRYLPWRNATEQLQVVTVMNFKGGSGKTTTSAHLAQFLALQGLSCSGHRSRSASESCRRCLGINRNWTLGPTRRFTVRSAMT